MAKAKTLEQAQAVLEGYIPVHNRKFAKPARAEPAWTKAERAADPTSFVFQATAHCGPGQHDYFRRDGLTDPQDFSLLSTQTSRVEVHVLLDGAVEIFYKTEKIAAFDSKTNVHYGLITNARQKGGVP